MGLSLERTTSGNERDTAGQVTVLVRAPYLAEGVHFPALITRADPRTRKRFLEFFTVNIRNPNTRAAYGRAAGAFLRWCEGQGITGLDERAAGARGGLYRAIAGAGGRLPRSSSIWPASACCLTGW